MHFTSRLHVELEKNGVKFRPASHRDCTFDAVYCLYAKPKLPKSAFNCLANDRFIVHEKY